LKDNVLVIAALKPQTGEEEHGVYFQKERNFGRFYRKVPHRRYWIVVLADP
jgi:HSP20 family molecular chaperone IbpA